MSNVIISEEDYKKLKTAEKLYNDIRYALRKDETIDESISCVRDIPSDVEMVEDLKKRAADFDYYKEKSELLEERNNNQFNTIREKNRKISEIEEKLKKANELADSWKRDYETCRDQIISPIYNILYPDKVGLDTNVTDLINNIKDLKYWKERCHSAETDVTTLNSKVEVLEKKLQKADSIRDAVWNESKLNQTISDQDATIKALLITIKEMCKEDETNE